MDAGGAVGQQGQRDLEHFTVEDLMALAVPDDLQLLAGGRVVEVTQVGDLGQQCAVADALGAVGQNVDPQHRVPV